MMDDPLTQLMKRPAGIIVAAHAHQASTKRIRARLLSGPTDLRAEAEAMVAHDFGLGADLTDDIETQTKDGLAHFYESSLRQTEAYLWGLGIAGLYHQWERDTKIFLLSPSFHLPTRKVHKADWCRLMGLLSQAVGFDLSASAACTKLEEARLITNAIKHGGGDAMTELFTRRRDLFHTSFSGYATVNPRFDQIVIGVHEFDESAAAITQVWTDFETAVIKRW